MHKHAHKHTHNHNVGDIDAIAYESGLSGISPSFKCVFSLTALILCIALKNMYVYIFTFAAMSFVTLVLGKTHLHTYTALMCVPLAFVLLSSISLSFDIIGGIRFSHEGFKDAVNAFAAAMSGVSCMYALALSTPVSDIIEVLKKIKMPNLIIELMFLIYRFIFVISSTAADMMMAARARHGFKSFKNSILTFSHIAKNLLICSLKKSNDFYNSLIARRYKGRLSFYCNIRPTRACDMAVFVLYIVMVGALCFL